MRLIDQLVELARRVVYSARDPWERLDGPAPLAAFGPGARRQFGWYLTGESAVAVHGGADVRDWLLGCEYVRDEQQFAQRDVWQHPCDFERARRGDCEDHALWAWRKFLEIGYDAELVVGTCEILEASGRHAWVVVGRGAERFLVEGTMRAPDRMIVPLEEVRSAYVPECGVGRDLEPFLFAGVLRSGSGR